MRINGIFIILFYFIQSTDAIWLLKAISHTPNISTVDSDTLCKFASTTKSQRLCEENIETVRSLGVSINNAIAECQKQFANEPWDCVLRSGLNDVHLKLQSKERALIWALTSSSTAQSLAKRCARGLDANCGCGRLPTESSLNKTFLWGGCSDNFKFGNRFTRKLLAVGATNKTADALIDKHNSRAGHRLLSRTVRSKCKCHGVSGSCTVQSCWKVASEIPELVSVLHQKYRRAARVRLESNATTLVLDNQNETSIARPQRSLNSEVARVVAPSVAQLVFKVQSPNLCDPDPLTGRPLSVGRECSKPNDCHRLCCGRGFVRIREAFRETCNCRFVYCCRVECDECEKEVERFYCR
ncbi:Protein Wnt [Aphelenchoides besseyi]|nr:Protein Wnt [Aphelenchoides besseyi]KAI6200415.1 Protein Wnt [Aphelenchoides besseyi]